MNRWWAVMQPMSAFAEGGPPALWELAVVAIPPLALLMAAPASAEERTVIWQVTWAGESMSQKSTHAGE